MNLKQLCIYLLLAFSMVACSTPESNVLRFGLATAPVSLDPRFATDATSARINRLLYRALVDFDDNLRPIPSLANWEQLNSTHYRFHLGDQGRTFHDGSHLTAADVKATYAFILTAGHASPHRGSLTGIQEITVIDADTVDFILKKPDILFPGRLNIGIVPATHQTAPLNKQPVGSGTFRFVAWPQTSHLQLQRLRDGQRVDFLEIKDPVVRVLKLVRGEIDLLQNDLPPELITWLAKRPEIRISKRQGSNFSYLGFNLQDPVTGQLAVRQAIAYALNREEIIHYVLGDAARLASGLLPPTHWAGSPELPSYPYNPEKARTLLSTVPVHLTFKTSNKSASIRLAAVIQQQLAAVGIQLDLRSYDWGTFYGDIKSGRFQLYSLSWVGIKMPDIFRYAFHSSALPPEGANRGRLQNPQVDALIEQAEQALTLDEQAGYYRQLQHDLLEELPYIPLWYEDHVVAIRETVSGYTLAADGHYDSLNTATKSPGARVATQLIKTFVF